MVPKLSQIVRYIIYNQWFYLCTINVWKEYIYYFGERIYNQANVL